MTKALVVYESMYGNTGRVAEAVASGLRASAIEVELASVDDADEWSVTDSDVVVVGGPTHAFGLSRRRTRADAARRSGFTAPIEGIGLREWMTQLWPGSTTGRPAAAFDTRISKPRVPGSAARAAARRLQRLGFALIAEPETFWVEDVAGPLAPGEIERAEAWGRRLAAIVAGRSTAAASR